MVEESEGCEFVTLISPLVSLASNLARRGRRKEEEWGSFDIIPFLS